MTANFGELLGKQVDEVERPKPFPVGPYDAMVISHENIESSQKGTPGIRFMVKLMGPRDGVEPEPFEEAGGMEKLNARQPLRYDFWLTNDSMWRLRDFLENGLDLQCSGQTFDAVLPETGNVPFIAQIGHRAGQKEGDIFMEIIDHARAD